MIRSSFFAGCVALAASTALSTSASAQEYQPGQPLPPGMLPPPEYEYTPGHLLPEGYHLENRPRSGFLVGGFIVTAVPYFSGLLVAAANGLDNKSEYLFLPFAGPWLTLGMRERACNEIGDSAVDSPHCFTDRSAEWLLGIDGVMQGIGGVLVLMGYTLTKPYAVRDGFSMTVVPAQVGSGYGLQAIGTTW